MAAVVMMSFLITACNDTYNHQINRLDWKNTVAQESLNDCGVAVMKMIFNYYNHNISQEEIYAALPLSDQGVSMFDLKAYAEENAFEVEGIRCSESTLQDRLPPTIFLMDWDHFIVVDSVASGETVYLRDPLQGRCTLDVDTFFRYTDGLALIIHKPLLNPNQKVL